MFNSQFSILIRGAARVLTVALALLAAGCGMNSMTGSGKLVTEPRNVSGFSSVAMNGSGQLIIEQTGMDSLSITADDNLLPYITSEVSGNQLSLGTKGMMGINPSTDIVYKLSVRNLDEITLSGSGAVDAREIKTDSLKTTITGSGDITLSGKADRQEISIAGSGNYRAEGLRSEAAKINIAGSGGAVVAASEKLEVNVAGSGSVDYIGTPEVKTSITGSGSVRKR